MFYSKYCLSINNIVKLGEKSLYNKSHIKKALSLYNIKNLEITFRISSIIKYEHGFIAMIMLIEKMTNNKPIFLLDRNTLSKKKTIKIGLILFIKNEMIDYYLKLCCIHSIPKFYSSGIAFNISSKTNSFYYTLDKILSNTLFSLDKDINSYYDYLGDLLYEFNFLFRTSFKNSIMNKLLLSNKGTHFVNEVEINTMLYINDVNNKILLEEEISDSDVDDLCDVNEYIDDMYNNEFIEDSIIEIDLLDAKLCNQSNKQLLIQKNINNNILQYNFNIFYKMSFLIDYIFNSNVKNTQFGDDDVKKKEDELLQNDEISQYNIEFKKYDR
jgi:hypothetical protein